LIRCRKKSGSEMAEGSPDRQVGWERDHTWMARFFLKSASAWAWKSAAPVIMLLSRVKSGNVVDQHDRVHRASSIGSGGPGVFAGGSASA
jgi:hypothetical protein